MIDPRESPSAGGPPRQPCKFPTLLALSLAVLIVPASAQIAAWDFTGESNVATSTAEVFSPQLDSPSTLTRGATAASSTGANSFRTTGFQNNGISTSNTDYFEATLSAATGYTLSLTTIDAKFAGTASYAASPGVSTQFAYSLDGTNFTLIGTAVSLIGTPVVLPQISVSEITALQNVPATTTITIRYYASGQTATGGWGFTSVSAADYGLRFGGELTPSGPTDTTPPAVISTTPADDSATAIPTTDLTITYDETILVNTGSVTLKKSSDNSTVETITIPSAAVTVSGATATINPSVTLDYNTSYYVEVSAGAFKDFAGNPAPATGGPTAWNFTTRAAPQIVISQYHEGDGSTDRYVELKNLTGSPISLDGYRLTVWSDTAPSDHEGWKSGSGTTDRVTSLDGFNIPANGYFLVAETGPVAPGYAASNNDLAQTGGATAFNGDDSVVLYNGPGFTQSEVVDAVSFTANQGLNISFYRLTDQIGFDFSAGTSILNYAGTWGTKTVAEVNAASTAQDWYLRASVIPETLSLSITPTSFLESASTTNAATATVTRSGPTTTDLDVTISISDLSEASVQESIVTIPIGSASAQFTIGAVDDGFKDGDKTVTVTVTAPVFSPGSQQIAVLDDPSDPVIPIVINEVDCDTTGTDTAEFVELYNNSSEAVTLDGLALVFYNGDGDASYRAIDLTGTIPANGFFVVGNTAVPNVNMTFLNGGLQNGADAVALYAGTASQFPTFHLVTAYTPATLLDAVVYDTGNPDDTGLLDALTPGKPQVEEGNTTVLREAHSIARVPNGGAAFDTTVYVAQTPTPGATNILPAGNTYGNWATANADGQASALDFDNDGVKNGVEYFFGATGSSFTPNPQPVAGVISYPRDATATEATFKIYTSPDLMFWTDVTETPEVDVTDPAFVKYTVPTGEGKIFVRLEVVVTP